MGERTEGRALSLGLAVACVLCLVTSAVTASLAVELAAPMLSVPAVGAAVFTVVLLVLANRAHDRGR